MCEGWDFRRGFSIKGARHKIDLKITRKTRGLFAKRPYLQPPDRNTDSARRGSRPLYRRAAPRVPGTHASPPGGGGHGLLADGLGGSGRPGRRRRGRGRVGSGRRLGPIQ
jgi:hypothetical protein